MLSQCAVAGVATLWLWRSLRKTRSSSPKSSSAGYVTQHDFDLELAEVRSDLASLSSTLRKLHGRASVALRRDQQQQTIPDATTLKQQLRQKFGIGTPRVVEPNAD